MLVESTPPAPLLPIGAVAARAGVSVQTLRHYDAIGLLRPSAVRPSGYRRYSEADCLRLDRIRVLREAGFDLATIAVLLDREASPRAALQLQLDAMEAQLRGLAWQRTVLRAVLAGDERSLLPRLQRLQVRARLGRLERERFLAEQLGAVYARRQVDPRVWAAAVEDLPETLDEDQLEAWLEMAELVTDPEFQACLRRQLRPIGGGRLPAPREQAARAAVTALLTDAVAAVRTGPRDGSPQAQALVRRHLRRIAKALGLRDAAGAGRWLVRYLRATTHAKVDRYWACVARLKGWPPDPARARGPAWVLAAIPRRR